MHMANKEYEAKEALLVDARDDPNVGKRRTSGGEVLEPPYYVSYTKKHKYACLHKVHGCARRPHWEVKDFTWVYGDESLQVDQLCRDCWKEGGKPGATKDEGPDAGSPVKKEKEEGMNEAVGSEVESGGNNSDSSTNPSLDIADVDELGTMEEATDRRRQRGAAGASSTSSSSSSYSSGKDSHSTGSPGSERPDYGCQKHQGRRSSRTKRKRRRQGEGRSSASRSDTPQAGTAGADVTPGGEEPQDMEVDDE